MAYNRHTPLWRDRDGAPRGPFFRSEHARFLEQRGTIQTGPRCVSHSLSLLTLGEASPAQFQTDKEEGAESGVNTQCPVSWSAALKKYGRKLAYCSVDVRRFRHIAGELAELDDLFTVSYYCGDFTAEPRDDGFICGSHIVVVVGRFLFNSADGSRTDITTPEFDHRYGDYYLKRVFRVVPVDFPCEL
jgi:hypothetical protein